MTDIDQVIQKIGDLEKSFHYGRVPGVSFYNFAIKAVLDHSAAIREVLKSTDPGLLDVRNLHRLLRTAHITDDYWARNRVGSARGPAMVLVAQAVYHVKIEGLSSSDSVCKAGNKINHQKPHATQNTVRALLLAVIRPLLQEGKSYSEILDALDTSDRALLDDPLFKKWIVEFRIQCWSDIKSNSKLRGRFKKFLSQTK